MGSSCLHAWRLRLLCSHSAGARDSTSPLPKKIVRINAETGQGIQTAGWKQEYLETSVCSGADFAAYFINSCAGTCSAPLQPLQQPDRGHVAAAGARCPPPALPSVLAPRLGSPGAANTRAVFTSAITTSLVFCIASLCLIMRPPHTPYECFHPLSHSVSHIHSFSHSGHIIYSSQDATVFVLYLGCFNGSFRNI